MENKEFVQGVLNHFQLKIDEEKLHEVTFSKELPYDGKENKASYILYPFYANRPYILIALKNMSNSKSLEMIYFREDEHDVFSGISERKGQPEIPYYPYDYLDISNRIANRLVQIFPYTHLESLESLLSEIMENLSSVIDEYHEDPRISFIEEDLNAKVYIHGYELDPDIDLLPSLMDAKVKYEDVMNLLMMTNLGVSNNLTPYFPDKDVVDDSSFLSLVGDLSVDGLRYIRGQIKEINKGLIYHEHNGFILENEWYFDDNRNLYLIALVNSVKGIKTK